MLPDEYRYEDLKHSDRGFIDGMRYVAEETIDKFLANFEFSEDSDTLLKIKAELLEAAMESLKVSIDIDIDDNIISMLESY